MVEPIDPLERREFHRLQTSPRPAASNHLHLEQSNHRLGEGIVLCIAAAADGQLDAGVRQPLRLTERQILRVTNALLVVKP